MLIHRDYIIREVLQGEHQFTVFIARLDLFGLAVIGNNERDESLSFRLFCLLVLEKIYLIFLWIIVCHTGGWYHRSALSALP